MGGQNDGRRLRRPRRDPATLHAHVDVRADIALLVTGMAALTAAAGSGERAWIPATGILLATGTVAFGAAIAGVLRRVTPCPMHARVGREAVTR